jgi:hypothetical protein
VFIAGPSPDAPLYSVGVNDVHVNAATSGDEPVTSHVSAAAAALTPILSILSKEFGIRCADYQKLQIGLQIFVGANICNLQFIFLLLLINVVW